MYVASQVTLLGVLVTATIVGFAVYGMYRAAKSLWRKIAA